MTDIRTPPSDTHTSTWRFVAGSPSADEVAAVTAVLAMLGDLPSTRPVTPCSGGRATTAPTTAFVPPSSWLAGAPVAPGSGVPSANGPGGLP